VRFRIDTAVARFAMHVRGDNYARVGISVGTATFGLDGETLDQLLITADQAMYRVKSEHKLNSKPENQDSVRDTAPLTLPLSERQDDELASISVN
jgi:GGDEF domain-containing protein